MILRKEKELVLERDWSRYRDAEHTISMWCSSCKGSGRQRLRSAGVIPRVTIIRCKKCKGQFRLWYRPGSDGHKEALKVDYSTWKRDGKHREYQGISRR